MRDPMPQYIQGGNMGTIIGEQEWPPSEEEYLRRLRAIMKM